MLDLGRTTALGSLILKMPESADGTFYAMLDSIAKTENAVEQNKRIKEAQFAEDSREPTKEEVEAIHREVEADKLKVGGCSLGHLH